MRVDPERAAGPNEAGTEAGTEEAGTEIVVVPHTHWDREWYLPFQRFRLRLVSLLDGVIGGMEADPRWHFTLDGQMAAVDDYLEIRPGQRERVAGLVREGRLAVGPWQILHDEFLCSGENIVRNLELGMRRAEELGAVMMVGYLPDQFGHCAQTPQILKLAGIEHACVWRGVPDEVRSSAFAWEAPDGTAIRTQYLPEGGYGNAASMFEEFAGGAPPLPGRAAGFAASMGRWYPRGGPLLAMYGADHTAPAPDLADRIAGAGIPMRLDTLAGYFAGRDPSADGLPRVRGELRSHARANILPGVISARVRLKQLLGRAERLVERYAEPLTALWYAGDAQRFLDLAWRRLIEASCHDSVTGCGSDETAEQVAAHTAEAEQLGRAVCDLVTAERAATVPLGSHLVFNPTPAPRTGLITVDVPSGGEPGLVAGDGRRVPVQTLEIAPTVLDDAVHPASRLPVVLERVYGRVLFGQEIRDWSVSREDRTLTFHVTARAGVPFDIGDVREALRGADGEWRVRIIADPRRTVAALVDVPALGMTTVRPAPGPSDAPATPVEAEGNSLNNGLLRAQVNGDGTLGLRAPSGHIAEGNGRIAEGLGRIVDGGDLGDSYNHAPPADDRLIGDPLSVDVRPVWTGPLVAAYDIVRTYRWPASADAERDARSAAEEDVTVITRAELRAGEPFLRLRVTFDNRCEDHRTRLHLPLPRRAGSSFAEGRFAVTERGLTAESGFGERPVPTFPASGFVAAGGLAVLLEHATEYEVTGGGRELALTLLRSVGYLSRDRNAYRDQPAGPQLATPQAQCRGERTVELAVLPYDGERPGPDVVQAAEAYRHDFLTGAGYGHATATPAPPRAGVAITGDGVAMTSLRTRDGWIETRMAAQHAEPTEAVLSGPFTEAARVDLRGRPTAPLDVRDGTVTLALRPWEIATVRLRAG